MVISIWSTLGFFLKILLSALCLFGGVTLFLEILHWSPIFSESPLWVFLSGGFLCYLVAWTIFLRKRIEFFETLEHEFTHVLFHWLNGQQVVELKVNDSGSGEVLTKGRNLITLLAPYVFPTLLIPFLILKPALSTPFIPVCVVLSGIALSYHFISTLRELKSIQPDLKEVGYYFALPVIFAALFFTVGYSTIYLLFGWKALSAFNHGLLIQGTYLLAELTQLAQFVLTSKW